MSSARTRTAFRTEDAMVEWLRGQVRGRARGVRVGIGDDAALVELSRRHNLIVTADFSIENVHFRPQIHSALSVGHRALARSLSDIAAMGGRARFALVALAITPETGRAWVEGFYAGLLALARRFGVKLIGGDTALVRGTRAIDVVVCGEAPGGRAILRAGARPGDDIFVSGTLGRSALGLSLLKSESRWRTLRRSRMGKKAWGRVVNAQLFPEPRLGLGRFLREKRLASAMIDLSDGLSTDLHRLCKASAVGARVCEGRLPVVKGLEGPGRGVAKESLREFALHGGEDYELLFTVPHLRASLIPRRFRGIQIHWIGVIRKGTRLVIVEEGGKVRPIPRRGFDHFERAGS